MQVAVKYRLSRFRTSVHTDIERRNRWISRREFRPHFAE
jgi:hypothetical protein